MIPNLVIRTKEERDSLVSMLGDVERGIYGKEGGLRMEEIIHKWGNKPWFKEVESSIKEIVGGTASADEKAKKIKDISSYLEGFDVVLFSMSFKPSQKFISKAYDILCKTKPDEKIVLDFEFDESVSSGAKMFYFGNYVDLTMRGRIVGLLTKEDAVNKYL